MEALRIVTNSKWKVAFAVAVVAALALQWKRIGDGMLRPDTQVAQASQSPASHRIHADGRVVAYPGAQIVIGTDIGGTLKVFPVLEKTVLRKGDLVAEIDASEQKAALAEARARVAEADVDIHFFDLEWDRSQRLLETNTLAQAAVDRTLHDRDAAKARRDSAAATAWRLATVVNKTRIVSPIDGTVTDRFAEQGEIMPAGARLVTVADLSRTRVEAEIDEYDTGRVIVGQDVLIRAEGFIGQSWHSKIEEIPDVVTSRRIKPQDPGRPSDTRVLIVKVAPTEPIPLKLGQRVELEVTTAR